ncbi:MAG: type II toxin-antitoxin system VapC family toxin [Candidatus Marinimicrobia bacterium]|nr:type II toxin-antitoxin system VapC family toxin [Candidatus Neomarinimicrobiota bacterium]
MLFDTDIIIWVQRGNIKAARMVEKENERFISIQTFMELLQGARNQLHHKVIKEFIYDFGISVLPLTENIGHRALIYVEEYSMSSNMRAGDAIIAATAVENNVTLVSSNAKHFKPIKELSLKVFKP